MCNRGAPPIKLVRNGMTYESMLAETIAFRGHRGDLGEAYYARPLGGPWPGVVLIHHMPGWDEWIKEATRKLAHHGFATIAPHLYFREGPGSPDDVGARVRTAGGVADEQVLGDVAGAMEFLRAQPYANGKIGVIGFCSGAISPPARSAASTRQWIAGAATWSSTTPSSSMPSGRLRPSISRPSCAVRYWGCSATTMKTPIATR
jgi:dienelactone hydrolase